MYRIEVREYLLGNILGDPGADKGDGGKSKRAEKFSGTNQKTERQRPFGTGLVRHCPQGLFSPFFTFLRAIFFRPFRLSLVPTICPWVSEDDSGVNLIFAGKKVCSNFYLRDLIFADRWKNRKNFLQRVI